MPLDNSNDFKMKTAEWRGYTVKALEDIDKDIKSLKREIKLLDNKIDLMSERITLLRVKTATIGGAMGLIAAFITSLLVSLIQ